MIIKKIDKSNINDLKLFIENNKSEFFRYYDKRDINIIENHTYTALYNVDDIDIGYGHLDLDGYLWLGIMISDNYQGMGYGKFIMNDLLNNAKTDIYLTVDVDNIKGYNLYNKIGFELIKTENNHHLMIYKK